MGIAMSTPEHESADELLRQADLAMYHAKANGKGYYALFDANLNAVAMERLELETDLRRAIEGNELRVFYQPIVSLSNRQICGVEALVRWQHPTRGLISPAAIIPLAEETGLIIRLGQWVLEEACRQVRTWQQRLPVDRSLGLSVNLSARQFRHDSLVSEIGAALRASGIAPMSLTLEITESALIRDPVGAVGKLQALKQAGVRLAIDDFGTGYSSLSYLKQFPLDALKIDRTFVEGLIGDPRDRAIVQGVVAMAHALGLDVVGEGIETAAQAAQLKAVGCQWGQGNLFAKPMSAAQCEGLLFRADTVVE